MEGRWKKNCSRTTGSFTQHLIKDGSRLKSGSSREQRLDTSLITHKGMLGWCGIVLYYIVLYSFIHYGDLYSAPSRLLLRSAPNPCTAKKKSFETRVECVRKNPGEQSLRQRKPIPHRGT